MPKKILILGGGYIAVEFASIFNGLGVDLQFVLEVKKILKGFDSDIVDNLTEQMQGIKFITGNFPNQIIKKNSSSFNVIFSKKCN